MKTSDINLFAAGVFLGNAVMAGAFGQYSLILVAIPFSAAFFVLCLYQKKEGK
jgi:hypothetical protein